MKMTEIPPLDINKVSDGAIAERKEAANCK